VTIQPNIPQEVKLSPNSFRHIASKLFQISNKAVGLKPDIVFWPETAILGYLPYHREIAQEIRSFNRKNYVYLISGFPHYTGFKEIFNSAYLFSPQGRLVSRYDKQHLVPFGEYLPFRPILRPLLFGIELLDDEYSFGKIKEPFVTPFGNIGMLICFESTFPYMVRDRINHGAQFLVCLTNDAWFFDYPAPYQHINAAIMRAVENRTYFIQAANTGVSAIIDPYGRVVVSRGVGEEGAMFGRIGIRDKNEVSFYSRYGEWVVGACWVVCILYLVVWGIRRKLNTKYSH
ncbi:MAG: apolipoprotein N-acyltransferase, partial [bacterium]